jgi:hypothetical protein
MYVCNNEQYAAQQWIVSTNSAFVLLTAEPQQAMIQLVDPRTFRLHSL